MNQVSKKLRLAVGRIIGTAKRRQPDVVDAWKALCMANGVSPGDRAAALMAWDLEQSGADLGSIELRKGQSDVQRAAESVSLATQVTELASSFTTSWLQREQQHRMEMEALLQEIRTLKMREIGYEKQEQQGERAHSEIHK